MHVHVAIFKWKTGTTTEQINDALVLVKQVRSRVPDIVDILCGENTSKWGQGFSHAVVVLGRTEEAIAAYRADEVHKEAARVIDAMELDGIGVDFIDFE
ncbi:hypothetical protein GRI43_12605 [Altererythrobacter luteolus]|uniref:Stress-response A/B barrel domain-containing protein n=1 Tax=Pontixanthobacter luteolus TaxID=295089 RepID=A0A6I4V3C7_9SPHN|nr:Dabb family protein [Pontixanthobacter luteolus]MXP48228.1 hypothetical protein [Pontixanthobacter luteolus]